MNCRHIQFHARGSLPSFIRTELPFALFKIDVYSISLSTKICLDWKIWSYQTKEVKWCRLVSFFASSSRDWPRYLHKYDKYYPILSFEEKSKTKTRFEEKSKTSERTHAQQHSQESERTPLLSPGVGPSSFDEGTTSPQNVAVRPCACPHAYVSIWISCRCPPSPSHPHLVPLVPSKPQTIPIPHQCFVSKTKKAITPTVV